MTQDAMNPQELEVQAIGYWEAQIRTARGLAEEAAKDLTPKRRVQTIARMLALQFIALCTAAQSSEEQEAAAKQADVGLLLPDSSIIIP